MRYFEDFRVGAREDYGTTIAEEAEMLAFATEFDPQPMHLDAGSAQARSVGGVIASGWYSAATNMRMLVRHFLLDSACLGSPGVASLKWLAPVRPGDRLTGTMEVLSARESTTKPDRGLVDFRFVLVNQAGNPVLEIVNLVIFARRHRGTAAAGAKPVDHSARSEAFEARGDDIAFGFVDELRPGAVFRFGTYRFVPETIIRFAERFDPQAFHLSEAAGKAGPFGGLAASGWHTTAAWMKTVIDFWSRHEADRRAADPRARLPRRGPGLGFTDLAWRQPVLAGDTLTYYARILEARLSASRPGWGILTQRNYAINQHGLAVFAFTGSVIWEARGHAA